MSEKFQEPASNWHETNPEAPLPIDAFPAELGFTETEELRSIKQYLREAMISGDDEAVKGLIAEYYQAGAQIVEEFEGDEYGRAQLGLLITIALVRRDANRFQDFLGDLDDSLEYAATLGYEDIVEVLRRTLEEDLS
jgi:hypothetical protein